MWKNLDAFLQDDVNLEVDATGKLSSEEHLVAVLALLLRATHADEEIGHLEIDRAVEAAAHEFQLDESAVTPFVEVANFLAKDSKKLSTLTDNLQSLLNEAQKIEVLKAVWKVIRADSKINKKEAAFSAELRKLLGLSLEQAVAAGQST